MDPSCDLAFTVRTELPCDQAIERATEALAAEGFGVLTRIDVQTTLKQKIDVDFRPYVILGACNPQLAHRALCTSLDVGLLLPCNVVVYEDGEGSVVGIIDPEVMLGVVRLEGLAEVAAEARERLMRVAEALGGELVGN